MLSTLDNPYKENSNRDIFNERIKYPLGNNSILNEGIDIGSFMARINERITELEIEEDEAEKNAVEKSVAEKKSEKNDVIDD